MYELNSDNDTIYDSAGKDTLSFGPGITADSVTYSRSGNSYVITITSTNETVTIMNWFVSDDYKIENIVFTDSGSPEVSGVNSVSDSVFVDSAETNTVIQQMSAFNTKEVASVAVAGDTNGSQDTMMLVAGSWQG